MRFLLLLTLLAGISAGIVYPLALSNIEGNEIGASRVFEAGSGFEPAVIRLSGSDAPIRVLVELTAAGELETSPGEALLTLTVSAGSRTLLAETLSFSRSSPRQTSPQLSERVYRELAGTIAAVEDGDHSFVVGPGDAAGATAIRSVDLVLVSAPGPIDPRVQPIGFALMAIGFVGLALSFGRARGRRPENPNSQPPPPRWGRGGRPR